MESALTLIPPQTEGRHNDFIHEKAFNNHKEAHVAFKTTVARLLSVNNWHEYSGAASAKFNLTNNEGKDLDVLAAEGFCISIDLPGPTPGPVAGDGLEWVVIERLVAEGDSSTHEEFILMTVRPIADPRKTTNNTAHFFKDQSTNSFLVTRRGNKLFAESHGRNELPNNSNVDLHDKIRNTVIALTARIGVSGIQWQKLVTGLIEYQER